MMKPVDVAFVVALAGNFFFLVAWAWTSVHAENATEDFCRATDVWRRQTPKSRRLYKANETITLLWKGFNGVAVMAILLAPLVR